jgi:hypothetical protein
MRVWPSAEDPPSVSEVLVAVLDWYATHKATYVATEGVLGILDMAAQEHWAVDEDGGCQGVYRVRKSDGCVALVRTLLCSLHNGCDSLVLVVLSTQWLCCFHNGCVVYTMDRVLF